MSTRDIKPSDDKFELKIRSCGVIVKDGKVLIVQINNANFWCLPGGHLELGEDTTSALKREVFEETQLNIEPIRLISLIENFYYRPSINKNSHEIGFYYLCEPEIEETKDWQYIEKEPNKETHLNFKWVEFKDLENYDLRPINLKNKLIKADLEFSHFINNELND